MENITYKYLFEDLADRRVDDWLFMKDPTYVILIVLGYLYTIYYALPKHMENRKPYNIKAVIQCYNVLQIVSCVTLIYGVSTSGWLTHFSLGCEPVDYSDNPMSVRLLSFVWWTFMLKFLELIETVFFILRKKFNQVSKLHVYHHASTFSIAWLGVKYIGGGMATFPIIINSFIHILMYSYYFLSAVSPKMQKKIAFIKPKLTMLQMIQFCILLAHATQGLSSNCNMPNLAAYMFIPNVFIIFGMFINFYIKRYLDKREKQKKGA